MSSQTASATSSADRRQTQSSVGASSTGGGASSDDVAMPRQSLVIPRPDAGATKCFIGRFSKTRQLAIFLQQRTLVSLDGRSWPPLSGLVTVDPVSAAPLLDQHFVPYAEVQCVFSYRSSVGTVIEKILYTETRVLPEIAAATFGDEDFDASQAGRRRFVFSFDLGARALPPSLCFDPTDMHEGRPIGVHWQIMGFLGQRVVIGGDMPTVAMMGPVATDEEMFVVRRQCPAALNFLVEYRYSFRSMDPKPPAATYSLRPSLFSFSRNTVEPNLTATLDQALATPTDPLRASLNISGLQSSHAVARIRLIAKQLITFRLPTLNNVHFKSVVAQLEDVPAPRYDPGKSSTFSASYDLRLAEGLASKLNKNKKPKIGAQVMPLEWGKDTRKSDGKFEFVPSTPGVQETLGTWGLDVKYILHVQVLLTDKRGGLTSRDKELEVELPFVLTNATDDEIGITGLDQLASNASETVFLRPDALVPLLSETLDDLEHSFADIAQLKTEWRQFRDEAGADRMATRASDHARILLDILSSLNNQLRTFTDSFSAKDGAVPWPRNPVPFNMLLLETELLARASPDNGWDFAFLNGSDPTPSLPSLNGATQQPTASSAVDALLTRFETYLFTARGIVLAWVAARGSKRDDAEEREFAKKVIVLDRAKAELRACLEGIVNQDQSSGGGGEIDGGDWDVPFGTDDEGARRRVARADFE